MTFALSCRSRGASSDRRAAPALRRRATQWGRHVLLPLLCVLVTGCGWARGDARQSQSIPPMVWPAAPSEPRIELLSLFARGADLGIEPSIWARLASLVTGGGEPRLVRPTGVAASGARVAVADPGAGVVQVYDLAERRALALGRCGDAALVEPVSVAFLAGHIYVSDAAASRIDAFDGDGACTGGWRLAPGSRPAGLAADEQRGRLYVADAGAHQVLAFDPQGTEILRFGRRGAGAGEFNYPTWIAVDGAGHLYVTDALNFRVQSFDESGKALGRFGGQGDGSGDLARPKGIAVDGGGHIFLVDALFDAVQMFDGEGRYLMVFGERGRGAGHFWLPSGVAVAGDRIYVADSYNQRVQVFRFLGGAS